MTASPAPASIPANLSTRERILVAALQLFAQHGFGGASIRDLARSVGIRESSLYNHFPSKVAILEAIMREHGPASSASRLEEPRYRALADRPAAFCRLYALDLVAQWSDPREHQFQKLITAERNRIPGLRAQFADQLYSREQNLMVDFFRGFALGGSISTPDPRETARLFMAGLIYIRLEHYVMGAQPSPPVKVVEAIDRFLSFFLSLIAVRQDAARPAAKAAARNHIKQQKNKGVTRGKGSPD
jgi:AcrR family transcriptional regulator